MNTLATCINLMRSSDKKVQVWILLNEKKRRVLLLQTTLARGMFWQPITGGVEEGETLEAAAEREMREETGLNLGKPTAADFSFKFAAEGRGLIEETVFYYVLETKPPEVMIDPREHQVYCWLSVKEAAECIKWDSNQTAFERVLEKAFGSKKSASSKAKPKK